MTQDNRVVFLKGKSVSLRPLSKEDVPRITRWINDPDVRLFLEAYLPQTEKDEEEWLEKLGKSKSTDLVFIIETKEGVAIGLMGLHGIKWRDRMATTGAVIGEKEYWGKGLGSEAKKLLLDYAFNTLNLRKICSTVIDFNGRSLKYSLKCGYKEEGRLKKHLFRDGDYRDLIQLAVFREDFEPVWKEYQSEE